MLAVRPYDVLVTAAPLDLDSAAATSLADKAYVAIRDRLIMLGIRPGEPIDDGELARELGVGRSGYGADRPVEAEDVLAGEAVGAVGVAFGDRAQQARVLPDVLLDVG